MDDKHHPSGSHGRHHGTKSKIKGAAAATSDNGRMKGVTIVKPIVYGNVAWHLGKKPNEDGHTHKWTVYIRPYTNEDMSQYVKRIQFKLHESYDEPIRNITSPPYTLSETGWGEFEIAMKIFFQDSSEKPVTVYHFIKLFEREEDGTAKVVKGPINSEFYDEMVFQDPTAKMHKLLTDVKLLSTGPAVHNKNYELKKVQDLKKIINAKEKVRQEIEELRKKLSTAKEELQKMKSMQAGKQE